MTTDILIVSYAKDKPYLDWCLRSCWKFAHGFTDLVLVVPQDEEAQFREYNGVRLKTYQRTSDQSKWQIHAQAMKCMADTFCTADFILHTDSDCVFTEPITPQDYFEGRKPVMLMERYSNLPGNPWREVTEKALGWPVEWEFMRRHPQVNPRRLYADMRERISNLHQVPFENYVLAQRGGFPFGFTEHNSLGAYAHHDPYWNGEYHWIDVARSPRPKDKLYQAWSHSPPHLPQALPSGGNGIPLEVFQQLGL